MELPAQIFIDGGDPEETKQADELFKAKGWPGIMGQTTNPTLVAKNPQVKKYLESGKRLTHEEALAEYKKIVTEIATVTDGPISIQVLADQKTSKEDMLKQARVYKTWIPNGVVKFPCTRHGLEAAQDFCLEHAINITLNFSQEQAAAVYAATRQTRHRVFISPFVGRLDDKGEDGMDVVKNEIKMYQKSDNHVEVLTASVRKLEHLMYALHLKSQAITLPFKVFSEWADRDFVLPQTDYKYDAGDLKPIVYKDLSLDEDWAEYDIQHELTDVGLEKFMVDWKTITK